MWIKVTEDHRERLVNISQIAYVYSAKSGGSVIIFNCIAFSNTGYSGRETQRCELFLNVDQTLEEIEQLISKANEKPIHNS